MVNCSSSNRSISVDFVRDRMKVVNDVLGRNSWPWNDQTEIAHPDLYLAYLVTGNRRLSYKQSMPARRH